MPIKRIWKVSIHVIYWISKIQENKNNVGSFPKPFNKWSQYSFSDMKLHQTKVRQWQIPCTSTSLVSSSYCIYLCGRKNKIAKIIGRWGMMNLLDNLVSIFMSMHCTYWNVKINHCVVVFITIVTFHTSVKTLSSIISSISTIITTSNHHVCHISW